MSGIKPTALTEFYRKLHARGMNLAKLGEKIGRTPATIARVINGHRRRGPVWKRLQPHLTDDEKALIIHVDKCSAWNKRQPRPVWKGLPA